MKKLLFLNLLLLSLTSLTSAQICKISDSGDNVEVFSTIIENGNTVVVTVGNDSQDISANVTITVEVTYTYENGNGAEKMEFTGKVIAMPNQESILKIPIPQVKNSVKKPKSVKVKSISGTKCMQ